MQIQTTLRYHHRTPVRKTSIKNQEITSADEDVEEREHLHTAGENVTWGN